MPPQPRSFSSPTGTAPGTQGTWNLGSSQPAANSSGMCQVQLLESLGKPLLLGIDTSGRLTEQVKPSILNPASILSSWKIQIKTYLNCFKQLNMHYNCSVPPSNHEKCSLVGNKWSQNMDCSYANRVSFPLNFFFKRGIAKRTQLTAPLQN